MNGLRPFCTTKQNLEIKLNKQKIVDGSGLEVGGKL